MKKLLINKNLISVINEKYDKNIQLKEFVNDNDCGIKDSADYIIYELFSTHELYEDIVIDFKDRYDFIDGNRQCELFTEEYLIDEIDCDELFYEVLQVLEDIIDFY